MKFLKYNSMHKHKQTFLRNAKRSKKPQLIILEKILSQIANKYQKYLINLFLMKYQILNI